MVNWWRRIKWFGLSNLNIAIILLLSIFTTLLEAFGLSIFLPIIQFVRLDGDLDSLIAEFSYWKYILTLVDLINIDLTLEFLLFIALSVFLLRRIIAYIALVYQVTVGSSAMKRLRDNLFNKYLNSSIEYHDNYAVGKLANTMTTEVTEASAGITIPLLMTISSFMLFIYLIMLFSLSWEMTLVSIIVLMIASQASKTWVNKSTQTGRDVVAANNAMVTFLIERLRSLRLVRLSGTDLAEKNEFYRLTYGQYVHQVKGHKLKGKVEISIEPVIFFLSMCFIYFAYTALDMELELIGLYLVISMRLAPVVTRLMTYWQKLKKITGSIEVIEERFSVMEKLQEKDFGTTNVERIKNDISFHNVSYRYPSGGNCVLKNINLKIKKNNMIAIVGPSGSGKSTLIDLLPRLRYPTKGSLMIDDNNLEDVRINDLRSLISYSSQSPQIFQGTVEEHIKYGKPDATREEIIEASKLANAHDFINKLPAKYNTYLNEEALNLSGGQKQRLDLARALIRKAQILILDEPTSNLDMESEKIFNATIESLRYKIDTTIIIVSHNLLGVSNADKIVVLNKGVIEAVGTHNELFNLSGWYKNAWDNKKSPSG